MGNQKRLEELILLEEISRNLVLLVNKMASRAIELTEDQERIVQRCIEHKETSEVSDWHQTGIARCNTYQQILKAADFRNSNLSADQFEDLFREMRWINNRALSRNLYESNGLEEFNTKLRALFFGESSLAKRIDQFSELVGIGKMTLTQFLFMYDPMQYAIVTNGTRNALNLIQSQVREAREIVQSEFLADPEQPYPSTIETLSDFVVFSQFKDLIGASDYIMLNLVLWLEAQQETESEEGDVSLATVSLEKDLRKYLAMNPHRIGEGLALVGELYNTGEVGEIDILFKTANGDHVVVETKKGRSSDVVIGQVARYMGWVKQNLGDEVTGVIVVSDPDPRLDYSLLVFPGVKVQYYRVRFDVSDEPFTGASAE